MRKVLREVDVFTLFIVRNDMNTLCQEIHVKCIAYYLSIMNSVNQVSCRIKMVMTHTCNPSLERQKQEGQEFKVILGYTMNSRSVWVT